MLNNQVLKEEINRSILLSKVMNLFTPLKVFADELDGEGEKDKADDKGADKKEDDKEKNTVNFEDLVAKARKEEKDKLYPKIKNLETDLEKWTKKCNDHLIDIGTKESEIEALNTKLKSTGKDDSADILKYKSEVETLKLELEAEKKNNADVKALEEKIKSEYEVKLYREQQINKVGDKVIPELVSGFTKEDIDKSLELAKKRYKDLADKVLGTATNKIPPANTNTSRISKNDLKVEDIATMNPASKEYKELREKLGLK